ncbi:MAG: POTRA domain-containing protein, partial [Pseudoalteromonas sp.]
MFIKFLRCICVVSALLSANSYAAEKIIEDYEIKGLSGDLENNVALYLKQLIGEKSTRTLLRYAQRQVQNSTKALGYYNPTVEIEYDKDDSELIVKVERGPATRIEAINITLNGEGKSDKQLLTLIKNINLKQGDILSHGKYDSAHKKIESML